jgi:AbrB family looped-hinge helix DNA binding protein
MSTKMTTKGQVTIPKRIRDTLGIGPGSEVEFGVDELGRIVILEVDRQSPRSRRERDRFDRARGRATVKWRTDELMALLRGED